MHRNKSTMLLGMLDFKLLRTGGSQASAPWLTFHSVTRWRLLQVMVWVQTDADGLQVNFSTPLASLYRVKEVFKKAGWSTDGGKKAYMNQVTLHLQSYKAGFLFWLKSHCQQPKWNLVSYRLNAVSPSFLKHYLSQ